ncbi:transposase [Gemmatimonadetes bacterium T265]|nr:transposase [Gemmatimonadetes bacterium T265]
MSSRPPVPSLAALVPPASPPTLSPAPDEIRVDAVEASDRLLVVVARAVRASATCPGCARPSRRVHSRYTRTLADLPWQGIAVRLRLQTRRFFCDVPGCPRRIFAERLPATAASYARQTTRLDTTLQLIAAALGGAAGARLATALGMHTAGRTLLSHLRHAPAPDPPAPRVLGVDDFAWRRGHRWGTVLVDLERHRVIDLLPDRSAATFAAWLTAHPGVEVVSRDRGGPYADAVRTAAPDAVQVADRFHLVSNVRAALERAVVRHAAAVQATAHVRVAARDTAAEGRRAARRALYDQVVALRDAGVSHVEICEQLNLGRGTVRTWLAAGAFPERASPSRGPRVPTRLAPHVEHLTTRYAAGERDVATLVAELRTRGYTGSTQAVQRFVRRLAHSQAVASPGPAGEEKARTGKGPSPRQVSWLLFHRDADLATADRTFVADLCARCGPLAQARRLAHDFRRMLAERDGPAFLPWLTAAHASELRGFVCGLRYDFEAVYAGITRPWSQGQVEGQVHRLKLVKRSMYGRAGFALLKHRMLAAA